MTDDELVPLEDTYIPSRVKEWEQQTTADIVLDVEYTDGEYESDESLLIEDTSFEDAWICAPISCDLMEWL